MQPDDAPPLSRDLLDILSDDPNTIDLSSPLTVQEMVEAIADLDPSEWRDFGLHHEADYSAGSSEHHLGLYDLAIGAWATMAKTVSYDWAIYWCDDHPH